ncbi:MAG: Fic family protein [Gammaproteobacteria bacterium]|nr:Fic family protein [Gammaproteobacteria bacterium]
MAVSSRIQDSNRILDLLSQSNGPLSAREVSEALGNLTRITTIRRLNELGEMGLIVTVGVGRSTKYRIVNRIPFRVSIPVGLDAKDIDQYVKQPVQTRERVRYQRDFLSNYKPNVTRYLEQPILDKLHQAGRLDSEYPYDPSSDSGRRRFERFLVDLSFASSRLEGVDTDYLQTERLVLELDQNSSSGDRTNVVIVLNHKDAIGMLLNGVVLEVGSSPTDFNLTTVFEVHAQLTKNLLIDPNNVGQLRRLEVSIEGSSYVPESDFRDLRELLSEILEKCREIKDPFEQSLFALVHLSYLQPFVDGNKRTARILANLPLIRSGMCPISFLGTPKSAYINGMLGVYELNRTELIRDVFVSTYVQSAYQFHQDRERTTSPTQLSLLYRNEIDAMIRHLLTDDPLDPLGELDSWINDFRHLDFNQQNYLRALVIEEYRNTTEFLARTIGVDTKVYRKWNLGRSVYYNEIELPVTNLESLPLETRASDSRPSV